MQVELVKWFDAEKGYVKYSEMVAEIAPYMQGDKLPDNELNDLWYL